MPSPWPLDAVARLPLPGDNVAIATRGLAAGSVVAIDGTATALPYTVLVGHRFAVRPIKAGEALLSWERPFGYALRAIEPGEYVTNAEMLAALSVRRPEGVFPSSPNFENRIVPYRFDERRFVPAPPTPRVARPATFAGYERAAGRGVGTRNVIVLLGTSSLTASLVRSLAEQLAPLADGVAHLDGIVAVAHTEGGESETPNNREELLRALAGYLVHPNVGAIVAVEDGRETVGNRELQDYVRRANYPLDAVLHRFVTIGQRNLAEVRSEIDQCVRAWIPQVAATARRDVPLSGLCVALQCGGSDAFSGISGNPLAGAVAHAVVQHGGRVNLTETDELIGAEDHLLSQMPDAATARAFLARIERFKERLAWHGASPEGNPSAGNKFRGLYNIVLKSLGAAAKKSPATRVDHVTDYAQRMERPGFYFMDGPGNDLEGIAGQVAAGCNLIVFVTGNGSVTNFPFVPTLKITTTTARHEHLRGEMDVNAGRYLDGESMERLAEETFEFVKRVAGGERTKGERAGHSQISIWRNWRQTDTSRLAALAARPEPGGSPLPLRRTVVAGTDSGAGVDPADGRRRQPGRTGLIFPTSLCSSQIARLAAERLNRGGPPGFARFVALPHTEGCGFGGQAQYRLLTRSYRGYATHPLVAATLLLEHGCEKIPNDLMRREFESASLDPARFGWASVQLDGGIEKVLAKIEHWFADGARVVGDDGGHLAQATTLGLLSETTPSAQAAEALARLASRVVARGGSVLVPAGDPLLATSAFPALIGLPDSWRPTLRYGEPLQQRGFHVVETETMHWVENLTGLGANGATVFVTLVTTASRQGHPLIPTLQWADDGAAVLAGTVEGELPGDAGRALGEIVQMIDRVEAGEYWPLASRPDRADFQITRGYLGVST